MNNLTTFTGRYCAAQKLLRDFSNELDILFEKKYPQLFFFVMMLCMSLAVMSVAKVSLLYQFCVVFVLIHVLLMIIDTPFRTLFRAVSIMLNFKKCLQYLIDHQNTNQYLTLCNSMIAYISIFYQVSRDSSSLKLTMISYVNDVNKYTEVNTDKRFSNRIETLKLSEVNPYFDMRFKGFVSNTMVLLDTYLASLKKKRLYLLSLSRDFSVIEGMKKSNLFGKIKRKL